MTSPNCDEPHFACGARSGGIIYSCDREKRPGGCGVQGTERRCPGHSALRLEETTICTVHMSKGMTFDVCFSPQGRSLYPLEQLE